MLTRRTVVTLLCFTMVATSATTLLAQSYPTKPVRLVVPFAAGGPSDFAARTISEKLSKRLGQAFVIENKPGADGLIAVQTVLNAAADGYTLLVGGSSLPPLPLLKNPPPFDFLAELAPVSQIARLEWAIYVSPHVPVKSTSEFIEFARKNPDKLSYASSNLNEHLAAGQFMKATGRN
jgi:tripartite-type tricarboxylate transporter receptor subunit TctC